LKPGTNRLRSPCRIAGQSETTIFGKHNTKGAVIKINQQFTFLGIQLRIVGAASLNLMIYGCFFVDAFKSA
jgi:hypothetical protein